MKSSFTIKNQGFGLIEVMIAVALVAGAALLVSQFVTSSTEQQIKIRGASECEAALNSVIAELKEKDNNNDIRSWMPQAGELSPPNLQMRKMIANNLGEAGNPLGEFLSLPLAHQMGESLYLNSERTSATQLNNYQLITSATTIANSYYETHCTTSDDYTTWSEVDRNAGDIVGALVERYIDDNTTVRMSVRRLNLTDGTEDCAANWDPVPVNVNANASTNTQMGLMLNLNVEYEDASGVTRFCAASMRTSPGSDLSIPTVEARVTAVAGLQERGAIPADYPFANPLPGTLFCGAGSTGRVNVEIFQPSSPEPGVQYVCRLDYLRNRYDTSVPTTQRTRGTGWFLCSVPEAPIEQINFDGQSLNVSNVNVNNDRVTFEIGNLLEGAYQLHVKAIDVARNESSVFTSIVHVDLNRPTALAVDPPFSASSVPSLNTYRFQCTDRLHTDWDDSRFSFTEDFALSDRRIVHDYHAGINLSPSPLTCESLYNRYSGFAAGSPAQWQIDGPKTAEFVACDECGYLLDPANQVVRTDAYWFVESIQTDNVPGPASLQANKIFTYNAGGNSNNPYAVNHFVLTNLRHPSQVLPADKQETFHVFNRYIGRTFSAGLAGTFPAQNLINACEPYGTYEYKRIDGCGNEQTTSNIYGSAIPGVRACASTTAPVNTRYCPTFTTTRGGGGTYNPLNCEPEFDDCNEYYSDGGYCGARPPDTCHYVVTKNNACKYRECSIAPQYRHLVGNRTHIEHGESFTSCATNSVSCGQSCDDNCDLSVCNNGTLSPNPRGIYARSDCTEQPCQQCSTHPTHTVECLVQGGTCNTTESGRNCSDIIPGPGVRCCRRPAAQACYIAPHTEGPFATAGQCYASPSVDGSCKEWNDADGNSFWCGEPSGVSCPSSRPEGPYSSLAECSANASYCVEEDLGAWCGEEPACPAGQVQCYTPGVGTCPSTPTNGIYCHNAVCNDPPYEWKSWDPNPECLSECPAGQLPRFVEQEQSVCESISGVREEGCCGSPSTRDCIESCYISPPEPKVWAFSNCSFTYQGCASGNDCDNGSLTTCPVPGAPLSSHITGSCIARVGSNHHITYVFSPVDQGPPGTTYPGLPSSNCVCDPDGPNVPPGCGPLGQCMNCPAGCGPKAGSSMCECTNGDGGAPSLEPCPPE